MAKTICNNLAVCTTLYNIQEMVIILYTDLLISKLCHKNRRTLARNITSKLIMSSSFTTHITHPSFRSGSE